MPVKAPMPPVTALMQNVQGPVKDMNRERDRVTALIPTLTERVAELEVTDEIGYQYADTVLGEIDGMRKGWGAVWATIQEKTVKPLRSALDGLYEVNRGIDGPLEKLRTQVKGKMANYKAIEARKIEAAKEATRREEARLLREAEEKQKQADAAATPQVRGRLEKQAVHLATRAETVAQQETATPVLGHASRTRTIPKVRIGNLAEFLANAAESPEMQAVLDTEAIHAALNLLYRSDKSVAVWPGVETYDEIQIVSR